MSFWRVLYRCGRVIGHFIVHRMVGYILPGSSTIIIGVPCELSRFCDTNGKVHDRWHVNFPSDNERTIALWTNTLRAYEGKSLELIPPGPRSRKPVQKSSWKRRRKGSIGRHRVGHTRGENKMKIPTQVPQAGSTTSLKYIW